MNIVLRIPGKAIDGQLICCLGSQLAQIVVLLSKTLGDVVWYEADVDAPGELYEAYQSQPAPFLVGRSNELIRRVQRVDQFLAGVFLAVKADINEPNLRADLWTEDGVDADLGDAIVEIRAFDTSYFLILTKEESIADLLAEAFQCPISASP